MFAPQLAKCNHREAQLLDTGGRVVGSLTIDLAEYLKPAERRGWFFHRKWLTQTCADLTISVEGVAEERCVQDEELEELARALERHRLPATLIHPRAPGTVRVVWPPD